MKTGLRTPFKLMVGFLTFLLFLTACERDSSGRDIVPTVKTDTIFKQGDYAYKTEVSHCPDTALKVTISNQMISKLTIWLMSGAKKVEKVWDACEEQKMEAYSKLACEDYNAKADQLNILPSAMYTKQMRVAKDPEGETFFEIDTVYYLFDDAQILSIPIKITNKTVAVANFSYRYASLTFDHAEFVHLRNTLLSTVTSDNRRIYNAEYKVLLYFKETNVLNPRLLRLPIYAYTTRRISSGDDIIKIRAENKFRVFIDDLAESCSFDKVTIYKSGKMTRENMSVILQHKADGADPCSKVVDNFNFVVTSNSHIVSGVESQNRIEGKWTIWRRTDSYSNNAENGIAADIVQTEYSLMHERCCYKEGDLIVNFGYENYQVAEKSSTVMMRPSDWQGYDKALFENHISATYMGQPQDIGEYVSLYRKIK